MASSQNGVESLTLHVNPSKVADILSNVESNESIAEKLCQYFSSEEIISDTLINRILKCIEDNHSEELNSASCEEERNALIREYTRQLHLEEAMVEGLRTCGLEDLLDQAEKNNREAKDTIEEHKKELTRLIEVNKEQQIQLFGRVVHPFESDTIVLDDDDDVEFVSQTMSPVKDISKDKMKSDMKVGDEPLRSVPPSELIQGLRGDMFMSVLAKHGKDTWHPGRIESIQTGEEGNSNDLCRYRISLDGKGTVKVVTASQIARATSAHTCGEVYPVGTRVVSIYRDDQGGIGYYSGVVAEPPSDRNSQRYLLFFDDGYTQYSSGKEIYRIFIQSQENWRELSDDSQEFVKKYLEQYPERPMVRMRSGQIVRTELNGCWLPATVEHVDASLALMRFNESHREWIYRGSTRLEPLYTEMMMASESRGKGRTARQLIGGAGGHNRAIVEYTNQNDELGLKKRSVARKSTSKLREDMGSRQISDLSESENQGFIISSLDNIVANREPKVFASHKCSKDCLKVDDASDEDGDVDNPLNHKAWNPLEIPILAQWHRLRGNTTARSGSRDIVSYIGPCGRHLRTMADLERYLVETDSQLTVDLFCFDPQVKINAEFKAIKTLTHIADMSYGRENVPIACVNSVDNDVPTYIDYLPVRSATGAVPLNEDADFLVCCDCTDNCRNKSKCACAQLTVEASSYANNRGQMDLRAGYSYKRLYNFTVGGIFECNSRCKCDRRCRNRVVQHGIWAKLQIFKTEKKGWGIRALHAIPKGGFVCIYAGAIYDDSMAVTEGHQYGDEYQAELDYIETVEKFKEGYESDVEGLDDVEEEEEFEDPSEKSEEEEIDELVAREIILDDASSGSADSQDAGHTWKPTALSQDEGGSERRTNPSRQAKLRRQKEKAKEKAAERMRKIKRTEDDTKAYMGRLMPSPIKKKTESLIDIKEESAAVKPKGGARRSTGGKARSKKSSSATDKKAIVRESTRFYYGDEQPFVMDAKKSGNLGRYFNHSCSPNVFVQNVFINTHDPRFPEVAFFSKRNIEAGEEMTWDYNYQVGSVPNKVLYCYCGSPECRGRLL